MVEAHDAAPHGGVHYTVSIRRCSEANPGGITIYEQVFESDAQVRQIIATVNAKTRIRRRAAKVAPRAEA